MTTIAQTSVVATADTFSRPMPLIGFNTNAHHSVANWTIPAFVESTATLRPAVLRFPGGTVANYWDWSTGWFQNAVTTPPQFANIAPKGTIRAEEFKAGIVETGAEALFVVNFHHSDLDYQLQGLAHADSLGIPVRYVEIGNEHNLLISEQHIPPEVYAPGAASWADSIKDRFPGAKVCFVGGAPPNEPAWHDSIFAQQPNVDALAFHVYLGAGNGDSVFNAVRALSVPFAQLALRYNQSKFNTIPPDVEVWVTEFNLSETLAGEPYQHAETWVHGLYVAAMIHIFLENPTITMILNHNLTNQLEFAAISPFDYTVRANGVIMRLIAEVSRGMTTATRISFTPNPDQSSGSTHYPSLIGWTFLDSVSTRALVVNLSPDSLDVDLATIAPASVFTAYRSDPESTITGVGSLTSWAGTTSQPVTIPPYTVVQTFNDAAPTSVVVGDVPDHALLAQNFPNPFNPSTVIGFSIPGTRHVRLSVFDVLGREIAVLLDDVRTAGAYTVTWNAGTAATGTYVYRLQAGDIVETRPMVLMK